MPDQSRSQTANEGKNDWPEERPRQKQTAPGNRRMLRRHTVEDTVVPKLPETADNLSSPQGAGVSQS